MITLSRLCNIHALVKGHLNTLPASPSYILFYLLQIHPFSASSSSSSSLEYVHTSLENPNSFTVNYLINSCGLTTERAVSASKHVKFKAADNPDTVLTFLKNQGLTQSQISKIIHSFPALLLCNPDKNFLPKIDFLKSKGFSGSEVAVFISKSPTILAMSLENRLIGSFNFFNALLKSEEKAKDAFKRFLAHPLSNVERNAKPNIKMLEKAGVPDRNIAFIVTHHPNVLMSSCEKLARVLEEVKEMGFDPQNMNFLLAIKGLLSVTKSTWDRKIKVYKQWGWSYDDVFIAFRKAPFCMNLSEEKINSVMELLVNKMELKSSSLAYRPLILSLSLEKRIVPRCVLYQVLVSKGLLKPCETSLATLIQCSEKRFTEMMTRRYGDEAPELLKLYMDKLDLTKEENDCVLG